MVFNEHDVVWDDEKVSRLWDFYSRTPPYSEVYFSRVYGAEILRRSRLPINASLNVLDFGCGPGFILEHILSLRQQWRYTGLDFSQESVIKTQEKGLGKPGFNGVHLVERLPTTISGESFDAVFLVEVVEHLVDAHLDATLVEVRRLLRRGGVMIVTTPNDENLTRSTKMCPECGAKFHEWQHVRKWTVGSLAERAGEHGFKLRFGMTLDFGEVGWSRKALAAARAVLGRRRHQPHLIAVFESG